MGRSQGIFRLVIFQVDAAKCMFILQHSIPCLEDKAGYTAFFNIN